MATARVTALPGAVIAPVSPRLFGSFIEHMGRAVYTGMYEPGHPRADRAGFREDVLSLVRELGVTIVRYPGGNFASGYDWEDGVGPRTERPTRLNESWKSIETNEVGLHEFMAWAAAAGVEVMYTLNLGTRGIGAARALLEYANFPSGTTLSDRRRANGAEAPFGIGVWCLGNEVDGEHQIGHKTAEEYARLATETARVMRMIDPSIELVAAGSSNYDMPTFGHWERTVLEHTFDLVDHISVHAYFEQAGEDVVGFLCSAIAFDRQLDEVIAVADDVQRQRGSEKRITLAIDEWNVWYQRRFNDEDEPARFEREGWATRPRLIEDSYGLTDAVALGGLLNSLLRHADRVAIANLAQLVNVIAPIRTEPGGASWRQSTFFPFSGVAGNARGDVLELATVSDRIETDRFGLVDMLDVSGTFERASGALAFFLVNRSVDERCETIVDLSGFGEFALLTAEVLTSSDPDPSVGNTLAHPDRVGLGALAGVSIADGRLSLTLPPVSWTVIRLATSGVPASRQAV